MKTQQLLFSSILISSFMINGIASASSAEPYTVVRGDTLKTIAQKQGISLERLIAANPQIHNYNLIYPGIVINIPSMTENQKQPEIHPELNPTSSQNAVVAYTVSAGDTLKVIAGKFGKSLTSLIDANPQITNFDNIYPGMIIHIPASIENANEPNSPTNSITTSSYVVQSGDMLWKIAQRYGTTIEAIVQLNHLTNDHIMVGQTLKIPVVSSSTNPIETQQPSQSHEGPWVEYRSYTVQKGETGWTIAIKFGIPFAEFLKENHLTESSWLSVGQQVTIPIHHVPVKPTPNPSSGELLDWFTEAQYVFPIGTVAKVTDLYTGKTWNVKRTIGAYHADSEPLTASDAEIMKNVWGGSYSWAARPVILEVGGRRLAASSDSMPHSIELIKDNHFPGHFNIHFLNSLRHKDGQIDQTHQAAVKIAAGVR